MDATTSTRPDARNVEWVLPPFFMLRMAGLPYETVVPLRFPRTVAWTRTVLDLESDLQAASEPIVDAIEAAVGQTVDGARGRLIELRRDVFNRRIPRHRGAAVDLVRRWVPPVTEQLARWLAIQDQLTTALAEGPDILIVEQSHAQGQLRALATHPRLRAGLLLASPSLDRYLPTYLDTPAGPLGKRARRIERSLLEYVYRTAVKTSPFSWLTPVGLGRFVTGTGNALRVIDEREDWRGFPRLNLAVLGRLGDALLADPALRSDLPIQLTTGWQPDRDRIRYVRRQRRSGDDDAAGSMDILQENLFYLANGTVLAELLAAMADGRRMRFGDVVTQLRAGDPENRRPQDVEAYLVHLLRLGLLTVPALHVDLHHRDPVRGFRDGLAALGRTWTADVCERLDLISGYVEQYAHATVDRRRVLLESIRAELTDGQHDLGRAEATLPRTLLYEDVSLGSAQITADAEVWRERLLPAARGLARILPVFDLMLPHRLTVKGFFRARFGPGGQCDDLVRLVHEFHQDFYDQFLEATSRRRPFNDDLEYQPQENWFGLPEIRALDAARVELVRRMRAAYAAHPDDARELVLDDDFVDGVAALLPPDVGDLDPRSFFLQVAEIDGRPQAVLNRAYSGLTLMFSRFAHCFGETDGLTDGLRATLADLAPAGAVFAELTGGYDTSNLNLHPSIVPYQLVCPGDVSFRPVAEQIPVDDLVIVDDVAGNRLRLRSKRLGVEVIPVYLGFLMPLALPDVQRILLTFSYTNMAAIDLWSGTDQPLGEAEIGGHPRLTYRDMVLVRRLWKMDPASLPVRGAGQGDAEWFLDWMRWAKRHGLPRRVFVSQDTAAGPGSKPQYVDFDSFFSLTLLDNMIKSAGRRVVMTEMLPDNEHLWVRSEGSSWVTELTVEIDGRRTTA